MSRNILQGLIGAWCPSLGPSGYTLLDRSGRGQNGTLTNMDAGTDWVGTPGGWALDFDGTNDHLNYGTNLNLAGTKTATFSAWVYRATIGDMLLMTRYSSGLGAGNLRADYFGLQSGQIFLFVGNPTSTADYLMFSSTETITAGVWNHIAGSVFVDGTNSSCVLVMNGKACTVTASHSGTRPSAYATNNTVPWRSMAITGFSGAVAYYSGRLSEHAAWNIAKPVGELCNLSRLGNGWIGRVLSGQAQRRSHAFRVQTGNRRRRIVTGMV